MAEEGKDRPIEVDLVTDVEGNRDPSLAPFGAQLRELLSGVPESDGSTLSDLADALTRGDRDELRGWSEMDLVALADADELVIEATDGDAPLRRLELLRSGLIFLPIAITWLGIAMAAKAYGDLPTDSERYQDASFIALWESGFDGRASFSLSLFQIGLIDFALILGLIVVTLVAANRRQWLEADAGRHIRKTRAVLVKIQRELVEHRLHGVTRFRSELNRAAANLRKIAGEAATASDATTNSLTASASLMTDLAGAAESQRTAVESLGARLQAVEDAVDRLAGLQESASDANAAHVGRLGEIARSAAGAAEHAASAGPALAGTASEISGAMAQIEHVLAQTLSGMQGFNQRLDVERNAQREVLDSMSSLAARLATIDSAAAELAGASGSLQTTLGTLGATVNAATRSIPDAMAAVANDLGQASDKLGAAASEHGDIVRHVGGIATTLEVSLAQAQADLVSILASLDQTRRNAESSVRS